MWRMARDAANARRVNGRVRQFDPFLMAAATQELTELMAYTYLLRKKLGNRRRKIAKNARIELASPVHSLAAKIADQIDIDLGNVQARFFPIAKKGMKKAASDIRDIMNNALAKATIDRLPTKKATDEVLAAVRKHGIEPRSTWYVENLVRTHSAISYGAAHKQSFVGDPDLWGYEYVTVGDNRVRPEHEILDGTRRRADDPFWEKFWPPNGWSCRCQAVAIYDDEATQTKVPKDATVDEGFEGDFTELI
jgi:SPP1 gp7 family putative phage head morphogenesis protein